MPIREYETEDGEIVEVLQGSQEQAVPAGWKKIISSGSFSTGSVRERTMGDSIRKGYYKAECQSGSRFKSRFSAKAIKKAWGW